MTERRTSAAKDILTPDTQRLLENYGFVKEEFDQARDLEENRPDDDMGKERLNTDDRSGSKMVREDRPQNDMRPPEEFSKEVDRDAFDEKWFEEQLRAEAPESSPTREQEPEREP